MRLFIKIFITFFLIIIISFTVYSSIIIETEKIDLHESLNSKIEFNRNFYSYSTTVLLYDLNQTLLKSMMKALYNDKEIVEIKLDDYTNIMDINLKKENYNEKDIIKDDIELIFNGEKIGELHITYTHKYINELLNNFKKYILFFSLLLSVISLVTIYFVVKKLTKSLTILSKATEEISLGDLTKKIQLETSDEIGQLANKFDNMRKSLFEREEINKQQSQEIKKLNESLQQKVIERTKELENSNIELQKSFENLEKAQDKLIESEKMASLGSLVAGVAHEINTPIGIGLTGITHFMDESKKINQLYKEEKMTQEDFETFLKQTDEMSNLIKKNLDRTASLVSSFKRVAIDQTNDEIRELNLKDYINEIIFSLGKISNTTKIDLEVNSEKEVVLKTYPGSISQIITNLIINSSIHGFENKEKGKITITIDKTDNEEYIIDYKDDGKGIKKEYINKIFDPFFTTNRKKGGTGLGLNIIYNIVTNTLNGTIILESKENEGVRFLIRFKDINN